MKNVIVVSSSLRVKSSSRILSDEVIKGLKENNNVELLDLNNVNFTYCKGCLVCQRTGLCIIKDDINDLLDRVSNADILVFATPIYYYSISGALKTFLDRMNPLYVRKNKFKEVYALFTCADDSASAIEGPVKAIEGWVCCFDAVKYVNSFNGLALNSVNDVTDDIKTKAYQFGKNTK